MKHLSLVDDFEITPPETMNFRLSLWKPSHFPTRLEIHTLNTTWRTFVINGQPCGARIDDLGRTWNVKIYSEKGLWHQQMHNSILDRISKSYGLTENYDDFNHLCNENEKLRKIIGPLTGMRSSCPENLFELSVLTILLQNTTVKRSRDMLDAILRLAGNTVRYDGLELACFCTPESLLALGTDRLRGEAHVGYRDKTLLALAKFFTEEPVEFTRGSADDLLATLCKVKGIGPYTAGVVAGSVFHNHRAYGLDVWNRKIIKQSLGLDPEMKDSDLQNYLSDCFSPCEGLVVEAIVENAYLKQPVCKLYSSEKEAKEASLHWPR